jgi:hypothetical protein
MCQQMNIQHKEADSIAADDPKVILGDHTIRCCTTCWAVAVEQLITDLLYAVLSHSLASSKHGMRSLARVCSFAFQGLGDAA